MKVPIPLTHRASLLLLVITILNCVRIAPAVNFNKYKGLPERTSGYKFVSWNEGVICHAAHKPLHPTSLSDLERAVALARKHGLTLKATGSLHSANDIICTDGVPVNMHGIKHFRYDKHTGLATAGAGVTLGAFLEHLHDNGRSIHGIPAMALITIGGLLATSSHGSEFRHPATFSDQVVGVVVVDGLGKPHKIKDREQLRAFRAHLGLLGLLYEVTFTTIPQYKIHMKHYPQPEALLWKDNEIQRLAKAHDRLQFFWFPMSKRVIVSVGNQVPLTSPGNCRTMLIPDSPQKVTGHISTTLERMQDGLDHLGFFGFERFVEHSLYEHVVGKSPMFTTNGKTFCEPAIGYGHRMLANGCTECPWTYGNNSVFQFEFAMIIPLAELPGAIQTIRKILYEHPMQFPMTGIYIRFLPASDGFLTVNSDQASASIEWVLVPRKDRFNQAMMGLPTTQAIMQALLFKHKGRHHWGKGGQLYFHQKILSQRYPHLPKFVKYMEHFDPHGVFLNDFGRRLRYGSTKTSLDSYAKHCAVVDGCVCQNDYDCGDGRKGSYICGTISKYRVCKENEKEFKAGRAKTYVKNLARKG